MYFHAWGMKRNGRKMDMAMTRVVTVTWGSMEQTEPRL